MLHHISFAVNQPLLVAEVLAEICQGRYVPFPPHPGSYMVFAEDEYGTAIELYPAGTELIPGSGEEEVVFSCNPTLTGFSATHVALSVAMDLQMIEKIGQREGWRVQLCDRGFFHVVEFWIENTILIELLPPVMAAQYLEFVKPQNLEQFIVQAPPVLATT